MYQTINSSYGKGAATELKMHELHTTLCKGHVVLRQCFHKGIKLKALAIIIVLITFWVACFGLDYIMSAKVP